jgi:hypothetical protein
MGVADSRITKVPFRYWSAGSEIPDSATPEFVPVGSILVGARARAAGHAGRGWRLYGDEPGAREYRRTLSEGSRAPDAAPDLFRRAIPASRLL